VTSLGRTTTLLSLVACALLLVALLWGGPPRSEDELDQLRRAVACRDAQLARARELLPEARRLVEQLTVL
jgi:hypothetical protein